MRARTQSAEKKDLAEAEHPGTKIDLRLANGQSSEVSSKGSQTTMTMEVGEAFVRPGWSSSVSGLSMETPVSLTSR